MHIIWVICGQEIGRVGNTETIRRIHEFSLYFRQYHTGKNKIENSLFHPFKRALVRSHPLVQEIILMYREPPKKEELPPEVKAMMILE